MWRPAVIVLVLCVVGAAFVLNVLDTLARLRADDGGPGRALTTAPARLHGLIDPTALATTLAVTAAAVWVVRLRLGRPWLFVGLACLVASPAIYAAGTLALHGNTFPERAAPWLATMLLGMLYPLVACSTFAVVELVSSLALRSRMVFRAPSGAELPVSFNPLFWQRLAQK